MYILYANGRGQTFWDRCVRPEELSTFSTSVGTQLETYSTQYAVAQSTFTNLSTQQYSEFVSSIGGAIVSSSASIAESLSTLSTQYSEFSQYTALFSNALTLSLGIQFNTVYTSSLNITTSTLNSWLDPSMRVREISTLQETQNASASSLSTQLVVADLQTYGTLSSLIKSTANTEKLLSKQYVDSQISTLDGFLETENDLNAFSTAFNSLIISSSHKLESILSTHSGIFLSSLSETEVATQSTLAWDLSTLYALQTDLFALTTLSSQISTIQFAQISTTTELLFQQQDDKFSQYTSSLVNQLSSISSVTWQNQQDIAAISTYSSESISTYTADATQHSNAVSTYSAIYSTLNVSSLFANIYSTFNVLEEYCNDLVISTTSVIYPLLSTTYTTSIYENASTTFAFFDTFFSSFYISSVFTLVPLLANNQSTLVGNLFSTGTSAIQSANQSTLVGKNHEFASTTRWQTTALWSTTTSLNQSSILSGLSSPTGQQLSTFSALGSQSISTFNGLGRSSIVGESSQFTTAFTQTQVLQSTLFGNQRTLNSTLSTATRFYTSSYTGLFATTNTTATGQRSTITTQFISTLASYTSQYNAFAVSSATTSYINATYDRTQALNRLQNSTIRAYQLTTSNLLGTLSSLGCSTLYTNQTITLGGNTFEGQLDFQNFTNFQVNVRSPLVSGSSNYRVSYTSNAVSSIAFKQGMIFVDVSTITSGYSNNDGRLCLDLYRWGLPTTIFNEFYPTISTADYTLLYEYTIQDSVVYTTLLNLFPRLRMTALSIATPANAGSPGYYWRGTPITLNWSNYSFFPSNAVQAPAYNAEVLVDVFNTNTYQLLSRNGPYDYTLSTATLRLPYYTGSIVNPVPLTINTYIVGKPMEGQEVNVNVLLPQLNFVRVTAASGKFLAFSELSATADGTGTNVLLNNPHTFLYDGSGSSNAVHELRAMSFAGTTGSYLRIPNTVDFRLRTGNFTIEWYQYYLGGDTTLTTPTVFSIGTYPTATTRFFAENAFPIYLNRAVVEMNGVTYGFGNLTPNRWSHIAFVRNGPSVNLFIDGVQSGPTYTDPTDMNNATDFLTLGNQSVVSAASAFKGLITNFRWIKGTALYTTTFTPPSRPLMAVPNTKLLLLAGSTATLTTDSSGVGNPVTNVGVTYPTLSKASGVDGNSATFVIGATDVNNPAALNQFRVEPQLNTTLTSVSSITIQNIPSSCNLTRYGTGTPTDSQQLAGATLEFGALIAARYYTSTITLTSSATQTFFL